MKWLIPTIVAFGVLVVASDATAQCGTAHYHRPAPVVVARPVYAAPVTTYYAPPATVVYRPATVYRPAVPGPVVYGRPAYTFWSPYGGPEVRVPGQPILNTLRTIVP
ncbi:MAG: hypothetical protein R3E01_01970 [Pirellulaceae bacterium]